MPQKAIAGGFAGALTIIIVWAIQQFAKITIPAEVASALTTIISTGAVYVMPHEGGLG